MGSLEKTTIRGRKENVPQSFEVQELGELGFEVELLG
jgi:hypothetical protein